MTDGTDNIFTNGVDTIILDENWEQDPNYNFKLNMRAVKMLMPRHIEEEKRESNDRDKFFFTSDDGETLVWAHRVCFYYSLLRKVKLNDGTEDEGSSVAIRIYDQESVSNATNWLIEALKINNCDITKIKAIMAKSRENSHWWHIEYVEGSQEEDREGNRITDLDSGKIIYCDGDTPNEIKISRNQFLEIHENALSLEDCLKKYGLPTDLKYMAISEAEAYLFFSDLFSSYQNQKLIPNALTKFSNIHQQVVLTDSEKRILKALNFSDMLDKNNMSPAEWEAVQELKTLKDDKDPQQHFEFAQVLATHKGKYLIWQGDKDLSVTSKMLLDSQKLYIWLKGLLYEERFTSPIVRFTVEEAMEILGYTDRQRAMEKVEQSLNDLNREIVLDDNSYDTKDRIISTTGKMSLISDWFRLNSNGKGNTKTTYVVGFGGVSYTAQKKAKTRQLLPLDALNQKKTTDDEQRLLLYLYTEYNANIADKEHNDGVTRPMRITTLYEKLGIDIKQVKKSSRNKQRYIQKLLAPLNGLKSKHYIIDYSFCHPNRKPLTDDELSRVNADLFLFKKLCVIIVFEAPVQYDTKVNKLTANNSEAEQLGIPMGEIDNS